MLCVIVIKGLLYERVVVYETQVANLRQQGGGITGHLDVIYGGQAANYMHGNVKTFFWK